MGSRGGWLGVKFTGPAVLLQWFLQEISLLMEKAGMEGNCSTAGNPV